ncbi:MAG: DNA repair protein RecO [Deltaproteobacteria bacterium]
MNTEKLQAIVLSTIDYGDSDRIASLFTLERGRIKAFARGARKSQKRFGPALETFARINTQIRVKDEGLSTLQQADIVSIYPAIRGNLHRIAHAIYACELVDAMTPEGHPLPRLYRLLTARLERLEEEAAIEEDRRFFEINLLNILGYRPPLENCSRCEAPFGNTGAFQQQSGEPVCPACTNSGRQIKAETLRSLQACLGTGRFGAVSFPVESLVQAGLLLDDAIAAHTVRQIKSLEFLRQVNL